MILDQRAATLLQVILSSQRTTIKQLESKLNCTRRQVNYDLGKINNWLESHELSPIYNVRDRGLIVKEQVREEVVHLLPKADLLSYIPTKEARIKIILIQLFVKEGYLSLNHLIDLIKMSKNSVLKYVQQLKDELEVHNITITYNRQDGYKIVGNELEIRALTYKYLSHLLQLPNGVQILEEIYDERMGSGTFQAIYREKLKLMNDVEKGLDVSFVEEQLKDLTLFFMFLSLRIENKNQIMLPLEIKNIIKDSNAYLASKKLMKGLTASASEDEITYISMHLLGLSSTSIDQQIVGMGQDTELSSIVDNVISDFEKLACVTFVNKLAIKQALFSHLKPVYYRMLFNIPITNPNLDKLKQEYFDLFILVKKSLRRLEDLLNCSISDDEVGYVTLHFGAFLKNKEIAYRRKQCIIICPNGVSTSAMLKNQMEELIPEVDVVKITSPREFGSELEHDIDFIISTVPIQTKNPLIIVSPIMTALDKAKILNEVSYILYHRQPIIPNVSDVMRLIKQYTTVNDETALTEGIHDLFNGIAIYHVEGKKPMLNDLITRDMIQTRNKVNNWQEAIEVAAQPLLENKIIEKNYIKAMIKNVSDLGPYIVLAPKVAIPHARPEDGVNRVGISLLKLDEPVSFSETEDKDVNLIFVIAAVDNELHLKALSQLTELLEEEVIVDEIIQVTSADEIIPFIERFSK